MIRVISALYRLEPVLETGSHSYKANITRIIFKDEGIFKQLGNIQRRFYLLRHTN